MPESLLAWLEKDKKQEKIPNVRIIKPFTAEKKNSALIKKCLLAIWKYAIKPILCLVLFLIALPVIIVVGIVYGCYTISKAIQSKIENHKINLYVPAYNDAIKSNNISETGHNEQIDLSNLSEEEIGNLDYFGPPVNIDDTWTAT